MSEKKDIEATFVANASLSAQQPANFRYMTAAEIDDAAKRGGWDPDFTDAVKKWGGLLVKTEAFQPSSDQRLIVKIGADPVG